MGISDCVDRLTYDIFNARAAVVKFARQGCVITQSQRHMTDAVRADMSAGQSGQFFQLV